MDKNFKLIFSGLLSIFILINILFLIILSPKFGFNLKLTTLNLLNFDLIVSFLIVIQLISKLSKEKKTKNYNA